jgi:hypothetical protein
VTLTSRWFEIATRWVYRREVVEHVGGAAEGRLGVHDPGLAIEGSEEGAKGRIRLQRSEGAWEREAAVSKRLSDTGDELAPKQFLKDRNRQEESWARVDPPRAVRRDATHRYHAVDVWMVPPAPTLP